MYVCYIPVRAFLRRPCFAPASAASNAVNGNPESNSEIYICFSFSNLRSLILLISRHIRKINKFAGDI